MAISNDERREVAARLRDMANRRGLYGGDVFFANLIDALSMERRTSVGEILERLADLIEPEDRTCRIEPIKSGTRYLVSKYTCCGYELVDSLTDPHASNIPEGYCPSCGARVIGG